MGAAVDAPDAPALAKTGFNKAQAARESTIDSLKRPRDLTQRIPSM
jgi:hypothetical protein